MEEVLVQLELEDLSAADHAWQAGLQKRQQAGRPA